MENEIWVPIKGYEGLYEVSSFGRVRSLNYHKTGQTKVLNSDHNEKGYLRVGLYKNRKIKTYKVHRLVAEAFLPNWFDEPQINHIDENKENNNVDNLEWCDSRYNNNYGKHIEKLSKPILQYTITGEFVREWPSSQETERNGFDHSTVVKCCRGKLKSHKGYIWRYKEIA